jgi:hypothetical protein
MIYWCLIHLIRMDMFEELCHLDLILKDDEYFLDADPVES